MNYRVGIVGAGQLARMMAQAAIPLGIEITLLAASPDDGAAQVVPRVIVGDPNDPARIRELAGRVDVLTFDHELVDPDMLQALVDAGHQIWPSPDVMRLAQNKRLQREVLTAAGFPAPQWRLVNSVDDVTTIASQHGWPVMLKATRGGYDGRGVWRAESLVQARQLVEEASARSTELLAEQMIALTGELAVLVAGSPDGDLVVFPATETVQRDGICHELHVPARFAASVSRQAEEMAVEIARHVGAVGLLAIEFFVSGDDVLVNELAPRPHNSGHWTIEGAETSQFEQHLRAVLGWPLGSTALRQPYVVTRNLLGPESGDPFVRIPAALASGPAHVHWYGKQSRPGRKIGHITACANMPADAGAVATRAWEVLADTRKGGMA